MSGTPRGARSVTQEAEVLVVTAEYDPTADYVLEELNSRAVPFLRCDIAQFPTVMALSATIGADDTWRGTWRGTLCDRRRVADLSRLRSIYWRRPTWFRFPDGMSEPEQRFAAAQARYGLGGVLAALPVQWVNHPHRCADAAYKPLQLQLASECGLNVPRTRVTNVPERVRDFAEAVGGRIVTKTLGSPTYTEEGRVGVIYTSLVDERDWEDPRIAHTAHLVQEWVDKSHEVRLVCVAGRCFAAELHAQSAQAAVDWRSDPEEITYAVADVPSDVHTGVTAILRRLGLCFGVFDFVVQPDATWTFLELNANGQWAWIGATRGRAWRVNSQIGGRLCRVRSS